MSAITVESLLEKCDLTESDLNSLIEREHFLEISGCLTVWRLLALKLPKLNKGLVAVIEADHHSEEDRRLNFLELLKQKLSFNATYGLLVRKLLEIGRADDAHSLCSHLKDITPASARIEVDSGTGIHQVPTTNTTASSSTIRQSPRRAAKMGKPIKSGNSSEVVSPKARISDLDYTPFLERVQYVIATFNDNEFNAATTVVTSPDIEGDSKGITNYEGGSGIYLGMVGQHPVGLLTCSQGRDCEKTMKKGIRLFPNADYLVAAGVCYGFSSRECKLGDVLISKMIIDLGNYRIGDNVESRGDHITMKEQVKNIFCHNPNQVKPFEVAKGRNAKYFVGRIVSAPNLVDDNDTKEKFQYAVKYNKVYGGEMEGGEMLRLQKDGIEMPNGEKKFVQVIVIKSVTDFADGEKTKEWQFIGAQAAFNYVKDKMAMQPAIPMPASARVVEDGGIGIQQTQTTNMEKPIKSGNSSEVVSPKARISDLDYTPFLERVQYVIATFNDNEFSAATTVVTSPDIEGDSKGITNYEWGSGIYLGMVGQHPVGLLTCSQGRDCEKTMKKGIHHFPNAKYLVAAGVCYGFSSRECKLGDVLISDMIIDLGNYRIGDNIESRGDHVTTKEQVKNIFCHNPKHVKPFEVAKGRNAQYFVGKIVSAPNLVDDNDMKEKFKDAVKYNKVYGGEMEGGEMLRLQKDGIEMPNGEKKFVQVIVIKSVTDFADGKKTKEWQFIGAQAAFNYVKDKMAIQPAIKTPASARIVEDSGTGSQQVPTSNEETPKKNSFQKISPKHTLHDHDYKAFLETVHYILATFSENEFNAATTVITSLEENSKGVTKYDNNVYLGVIYDNPIGLLTCGHGRECEDTIKQAVPLFPNAKYLVAAGVCYAFDDKNCNLGDVLISNQIIDLGNYQIGDAIESLGDHTTMKDQIKSIFCSDPKRVKAFEVTEEGRNAKYFVGGIVSAPNLIDDSDMNEKFRYCVEHNQVYGGEMEGGELLHLQKNGIKIPNGDKKFVEVIVIKSVTNFANGKKTKEWQFIGAQAAFSYVKDQIVIHAASLQKKYEEVYREVVQKQTSVDILVARLNFLGLPRSGKSTTMKRLMGEFVNIKEAGLNTKQQSTGVAERNQTIMCKDVRKNTTFGWGICDLSKETDIVKYIMQQEVKVQDVPHEETPSDVSNEETPPEVSNDGTHSDVPIKEVAHPYVSNKGTYPDVLIKETLPDVSSELKDISKKDDKLSIFQKAVGNEDWGVFKCALDDTLYLISTDTGGQTALLELMSRFIMGASVNLIFSRLDHDLETEYEVYSTNEKGHDSEKEGSMVKLEDTLFQALASITCTEVPDQSYEKSKENAKNTTSKAMLVGTHLDNIFPHDLEKRKEELKKRNDILKEKIKQTDFHGQEILEDSSDDDFILALDNMSGDKQQVVKMRQRIEKMFKKFKKIRIPIPWLMLSICMRHTKKQTMTLPECQEIAGKLGIASESLRAALWFLHHQAGVLLYYDHDVQGFENIIILDIQLVFKVTTQLIYETFTFDNLSQSKRLVDRFKDEAKFSLDDLKKAAPGKLDDSIAMEKLVLLLEHHKILAKLDKEDIYFMPCVLKNATEEELKKENIMCSDDIAPLMIYYKCGYIPLGIFSTLITALISKKKEDEWKCEDYPKRNKVKFDVGADRDELTLIGRPTVMEVHLHRMDKQLNAQVCSDIRVTLENTLTEVHSSMKYCPSVNFQYRFKCPCQRTGDHLSEISGKYLHCLKAPKKKTKEEPKDELRRFPKEEKYTNWFGECASSDKSIVPTNPPAVHPLVPIASPDATVDQPQLAAKKRTELWIIERSEVCLTGPTIGEGGWGEVQVATFREIKVAAKILRKDISSSYRHVFTREIEMASRIRHPNLVQFIASSSDQMVILTELMSKSLYDHLYEGTPKIPPETFCISVSLDVAKALNYLHLMQPDPIIHRDISSANVLLEPLTADTYKAKVSDYGTLNIDKKITTKSPGCPPYSAPEAQQPSKQSVKMDVFSFGVLVLEQCTAVFPEKDERAIMIQCITQSKWKDFIIECIHSIPAQRPDMSQIISRFTTWNN